MILYNITIENDHSFIVTNGKTINKDALSEFRIFNFNSDIIKNGEILFYYKRNDKDIIIRPILNYVFNIDLTKNNDVFDFYMFSSHSLLNLSFTDPKFLENFDLYILNQKITDATTLLILPKFTAIPCKLKRKEPNTYGIFPVYLSFPTLLKRFYNVWSIT